MDKKRLIFILAAVFCVTIILSNYIHSNVKIRKIYQDRNKNLRRQDSNKNDMIKTPDNPEINKSRILFYEIGGASSTSLNSNRTGKPTLLQYSQNDLPAYKLASFHFNAQKMQIFIHNSRDFISQQLLKYHIWEAGRLAEIERVLSKDRELHLIDIGCNLGVFTLAGAAMGRKVLALDANIENVKRVRKSVLANNFQDKVTIVYNALSDHHSTIQMGIVPSNIGGSIAIATDKNQKIDSIYQKSSIIVPTVLMDDLIPILKFKRCVIKMDIEGFEYFALRGSTKFFKTIDVPVVLIEWLVTKLTPSHATWIIQYFTKLGYVPCTDTLGKNKLTEPWSKWPNDINWVKNKK